MKRIIAITVFVVLLASMCGCGNNSVKIPKNLKPEIANRLTDEEQRILNSFVSELISSFNSRSKTIVYEESFGAKVIQPESFFIETGNYATARTELRDAAKRNELLQKAVNIGFLIDMESSMGTVSPTEDSTPEEVIKDIEEKLTTLIEYYYK